MKFYCTLDLTIRKEFLEILVKDFGVATEELQRKTLALIDILKAQEVKCWSLPPLIYLFIHSWLF